ncbi:unnamed protein product [Pleuronectes platessa]|uniref:Uncharacterized protein n=1 Tax=Pleuronectes platessa TaxID=8262 RepID=A0A9N7UZL4_PLEPL|nr:unnamed protein product [Pleuronectes platessa]
MPVFIPTDTSRLSNIISTNTAQQHQTDGGSGSTAIYGESSEGKVSSTKYPPLEGQCLLGINLGSDMTQV